MHCFVTTHERDQQQCHDMVYCIMCLLLCVWSFVRGSIHIMCLLLCVWSLVCGWSHNVPLTLCVVLGLWFNSHRRHIGQHEFSSSFYFRMPPNLIPADVKRPQVLDRISENWLYWWLIHGISLVHATVDREITRCNLLSISRSVGRLSMHCGQLL